MAKTLLLFRHAKSDWATPFAHDRDRPLAPRGKRAAEAMGKWLALVGPMPDHILCSTAVRAKLTCELAAAAGNWTVPIHLDAELYTAWCEYLLTCVQSTPDEANVLMLVGHQPVWSETAARLLGRPVDHFPTGTIVRIDLPVESWAESAFGTGTLVWQMTPKRLPRQFRTPGRSY